MFFGTCIILGPTTIIHEPWSLHTEENAKLQSRGACEYMSMGVNVS